MSERTKNRLSFIINVAFIAVVVMLVYLALKYVLGWVLPFMLAFCIVSLVNPLIHVIKKKLGIKQEVVSILVMLLIYLVLGVLLFLIVMQIILLIRDGLTVLPEYYESAVLPTLNNVSRQLMNFVQELPPEWREQLASVQNQVISGLQSFLLDISQRGIAALSSMTGKIPSFLLAFVFTIMLSFFISMQYGKVVEMIKLQMPAKAKKVMSDLRGIVKDTVFKYFRAALTLMGITFVELSVGLLFLRTQYAIPIAAGIAVFDALPFFGTGAIMIPWCLIELLQGNYTYGIGLAILYGVVTVIRNIIEPKVVGDKLGLNPIVSLTAIYLGFKLFGVLGMIVMPILTQITMELHKTGTIRLFRETVKQEEAPEGEAPM